MADKVKLELDNRTGEGFQSFRASVEGANAATNRLNESMGATNNRSKDTGTTGAGHIGGFAGAVKNAGERTFKLVEHMAHLGQAMELVHRIGERVVRVVEALGEQGNPAAERLVESGKALKDAFTTLAEDPAVQEWGNKLAEIVTKKVIPALESIPSTIRGFQQDVAKSIVSWQEYFGVVDKGTSKVLVDMQREQDAQRRQIAAINERALAEAAAQKMIAKLQEEYKGVIHDRQKAEDDAYLANIDNQKRLVEIYQREKSKLIETAEAGRQTDDQRKLGIERIQGVYKRLDDLRKEISDKEKQRIEEEKQEAIKAAEEVAAKQKQLEMEAEQRQIEASQRRREREKTHEKGLIEALGGAGPAGGGGPGGGGGGFGGAPTAPSGAPSAVTSSPEMAAARAGRNPYAGLPGGLPLNLGFNAPLGGAMGIDLSVANKVGAGFGQWRGQPAPQRGGVPGQGMPAGGGGGGGPGGGGGVNIGEEVLRKIDPRKVTEQIALDREEAESIKFARERVALQKKTEQQDRQRIEDRAQMVQQGKATGKDRQRWQEQDEVAAKDLREQQQDINRREKQAVQGVRTETFKEAKRGVIPPEEQAKAQQEVAEKMIDQAQARGKIDDASAELLKKQTEALLKLKADQEEKADLYNQLLQALQQGGFDNMGRGRAQKAGMRS